MTVKQVVRMAFIIGLLIATLFSVNSSLQSWFQSPFVTSVGLKDVEHIPFPAVTVCFPNAGKWIGINKALNAYDSMGLIFDIIRNQSDRIHDIFRVPFTGPIETILDSYEPKLLIDENLHTRLGFSSYETELFYLIHLAIVELLKQSWTWNKVDQFRSDIFHLKFAAFLEHKSRDQATQDIKEFVCNVTGINCTFTNYPAWFLCNNTTSTDGFQVVQSWCQKCKNDLQNCLQNTQDIFLSLFASYSMSNKYFTKENLIKTVLTFVLGEAKRAESSWMEEEYSTLDQAMASYITQVQIMPNSNLTAIDLWNFLTGAIEEGKVPFEKYLEMEPSNALKNCLENGTNCDLAKAHSANIRRNANHELMKNAFAYFRNPDTEEFIPYCNFARKNDPQVLEQCQLFSRDSTQYQLESCFTFNNEHGSNLKIQDPKMGTYNGLNFMINFDHVGTDRQKSQPAIMMLHEPGTIANAKYMKSKHILLDPGQAINIKLQPQVTEITPDFEGMSFDSRQCNIDKDYHQINCLLERKLKFAEENCRCLPWFINSSNMDQTCDAFEAKCYENSMEKVKIGDCSPACSLTKYSTSLASQKSMMNVQHNLKDFGLEKHFKQDNLISLLIDLHEIDTYYYSSSLKKVSLVHLNFEDYQATVWTNDAKLTFVNMIGTLGGLLGVFLGFSFLGIVDSIIECSHELVRRCASRNRPKSLTLRSCPSKQDLKIEIDDVRL